MIKGEIFLGDVGQSATRFLRRHIWRLLVSMFIGIGILWTFMEPYLAWNDVKNVPLSFVGFTFYAAVIGIAVFVINGLFVQGFLRSTILVKSTITEAAVKIMFGDLFAQKGWKAIAVNDFFDSRVDNVVIHSSSLHGRVIKDYWDGAGEQWKTEVERKLPRENGTREVRSVGNRVRYPIGTTVPIRHPKDNFLFVALAKTDAATHQVQGSAETVIVAVRGLIKKARGACGNEPLNIPLLGSGLGRVQGGNIVLIDLILIGIFEEILECKVTFPINIVLHERLRDYVNLEAISVGWR